MSDHTWKAFKAYKNAAPHYNVGGVSPNTNKQLSGNSQISYNSTEVWHFLSGDSIMFHRL